ncbi:ABC transporter ATP-binding protein [Rickettsia peacockii]|uniref:ABC transporter ATP-binding protein n=1 Tax=Rickettsia peacockii TaxID=47589 RepID=UPI000A108502|nr:ABC transporter ATP-binding protein [Rickettsia peacockii]
MSNPYLNLIYTVWHYGAPWRFAIIGYYLALIVAQIFLSLSPYAFGRVVDELQHFKPGQLTQIIFWLLAGVGLMLLFWLFHGPARVVERNVALKIQQAFRLNIYKQLMHLPLKWHQDHHSGNIITRINRSSAAIYRFADNQFSYIHTIVKFVTAMGFLLWISPPLGFISFFSSLFVMIVVILFDNKLVPLFNAENEVENHIGSVFFDYISNITTILTLRLGKLTHNNLFEHMMSIWPFFRKRVVLNEIKWFSMMILFTIVQTIILVSYVVHTLNKTETIMLGIVVMIFRYQCDINDVFQALSTHYGEIVRMNTDIKSIQPILDDIKKLTLLPKSSATVKQWHVIEVKNLTFHHASEAVRYVQIFNRIEFKIRRGEKIALIGLNGGGKSTLMNLLSGLYTPSHVDLKIDEVHFNSLEPLQTITTLIPQDPEIFENTIAFNITMDLPTELDKIHHVVKLSGFSNVLDTLPNGLKTDIREKGLNLSVGQKQRLALARGLFAARFSSLILMDEPTSSVDLPTEQEILLQIINDFPESAMIISLHRLHLLPNFDSVIMLNNGKVIASGSVSMLLNKSGPVRDLWQAYKQDYSKTKKDLKIL